jgi:hypothetical protein
MRWRPLCGKRASEHRIQTEIETQRIAADLATLYD